MKLNWLEEALNDAAATVVAHHPGHGGSLADRSVSTLHRALQKLETRSQEIIDELNRRGQRAE